MIRRHLPFGLLLLAYLVVAGQFALLTPAWQAPDEPAHYNYVKQLAAGEFPIMEEDDYNQAYQSEVISQKFAPGTSIEPFTYQDYQPPLYYLLQTPVFWLFDGRLAPLRLFGVFLGAITLTFAYGTFLNLAILLPHRSLPPEPSSSRTLRGWGSAAAMDAPTPVPQPPFPVPWLPLTAAALFAFLPQHVALQASVNNDSLAELLIAAALFILTRQLNLSDQPSAVSHQLSAARSQKSSLRTQDFQLATLLGLAFLTKVTAYLIAPVIALFLLWRHWGDWRALWRSGWRVFAPAIVLGALWWGRNLFVYGWPDFLGVAAHDRAVVGQPTTAGWLAEFGPRFVLTSFLQTTFRSFWGQFGWMGVVMDGRIYAALGVLSGLIAVGWPLHVWLRPRPAADPRRPYRLATWLLALLFAFNLLLYLTYNITYIQHQGRYLFAALIPITWAAALGLHAWPRFLDKLLSRPLPWLQPLLPLLLALSFIFLDLIALYRFILPQLTIDH